MRRHVSPNFLLNDDGFSEMAIIGPTIFSRNIDVAMRLVIKKINVIHLM